MVWTKFFLIVAVLFSASCKKESEIGVDIQPEDDLINLAYSDTTTMITRTVREDSLRSDESPIVQIGSYSDPVFGDVSASLYTQLVFPNNQQLVSFGVNPVLDSLVLHLSYDFDFYGDTTFPQTFEVYRMTDALYLDSNYYSNQVKSAPTLVGSVTGFSPHPRQNVQVVYGSTKPHLRIPMDPTFGNMLINATAGDLANSDSFRVFMKGLYIKPVGTGGALLRFLPKDSLTRLRMYYHNDADDTLQTDFVINNTAAYYSHFLHTYTNPAIVNQLNNTGAPYNEVFIHAAAGLKTKITFPFLAGWQNLGYPIAINKAELIIKANPIYATQDLPLNKQLYLVYLDSAGTQYLLPDMFENSAYFGGSLNTLTNEYHINMARYFHRLMAGELPNNGLYLKEIFGVEQGRRAVLGSSDATAGNYLMYLHLVYTRIN
ncbi:MAG TPA: DUF4270 family protein [Bacteroidia bacterium]|nr:DUF4270 family protein [Bacteroidia bacterium]